MESSLEVTMCKIGALPYERCRTSATSGETVSATPALDFRGGRFSTSTGGRRSPGPRNGAYSNSSGGERETKNCFAPNGSIKERLPPPPTRQSSNCKNRENPQI